MTCTAAARPTTKTSRCPKAPTTSTCSPTATTRSKPTPSTSTAAPAFTSRRSRPKRSRPPNSANRSPTPRRSPTPSPTAPPPPTARSPSRPTKTRPTCTGAAAFTSGPTAVDLDKTTEVTSEHFTPRNAGTYYWIATYHSTADPQATDISTTCKEAGETSVVAPPGTPLSGHRLDQRQPRRLDIHVVGSSVHDTATLSGIGNNTYTGTLTFKLYDNETCDASGRPAPGHDRDQSGHHRRRQL